MLKNLMYLITTKTFELFVTLFTVTVNKNGDLLLRFVKELGPLANQKEFVPNALVAVTTDSYQSKVDSNFVLTFQENDLNINRLAFNVDNLAEPLKITILGSKMSLLKTPKLPIASDVVLSAIIENADVQRKSGISTIIKGDATHIYELYEFKGEKNIAPIPKEQDVSLFNLPRRTDHFNEEWKNLVLSNMEEFFIKGNEKLIPSLKGTWNPEYVEGDSFPYMNYFSKVPSFVEWKTFFNLPLTLLKKVG